ncbi:MAG TPA: hypothetical protein VMT80_01755 [Candidatus Paceibacterota bacterium]|nr:hypothetical protein [Candidatus Paceibacterota bacterium]
MRELLTDLLPPERHRQVTREERLRLGVVALALLILLVASASVLLVPTYTYLSATAQEKRARLASMDRVLTSAEEIDLSHRLDALTQDATSLRGLKDAPSASAIIRTVLLVPHPGISLSGVNYAAASGKTPASIALVGTASTRDALRKYEGALDGAPFSAKVDLPVSTFAQDANLAFTITVTLSP